MKIALISNPYRDQGLHAAQQAQKILESNGAQCCFCLPFELSQRSSALPTHLEFFPIQQALANCNAAVCFGGDGTILHAARSAATCGVPLLGVNLGNVGFMAELEENELDRFRRLLTGQYTTELRMMLNVQLLRSGQVIYERTALNDALVCKSNVARTVEMELLADDVSVYQMVGDGVIVATPTGSTAYSLSAGGPVVEPGLDSMIATPVCAHQLTARPVIIAPERTVTIRLPRKSRKKNAYLSVDGGKAIRMTGTDCVVIRKAECSLKLICLGEKSFYQRLNQKLGGYAP